MQNFLIETSLQDKRGQNATLRNFISDALVTKCVEVPLPPPTPSNFCDTDWLQLIAI